MPTQAELYLEGLNPKQPLTEAEKHLQFQGDNVMEPIPIEGNKLPTESPSSESFSLKPSQYDEGFLPNIEGYDNLTDYRARNQPWHHEMANFAVQLGAEVTGGTLEGFGYLAELMQGNIIAVDSENLLIKAGQALKEISKESNPIYQSNPDAFMLTDHESFWNNMVSVGSTLSMMIPSLTATKTLSLLGKASSALANTSRGSKILSKINSITPNWLDDAARAINSPSGQYYKTAITQATLSRQIENNLEAYGTYEQLKSELEGQINPKTNKEFTLEEIEEAALDGAKETYVRNWAMLGQDIFQYLSFGKIYNPIAGKVVDKMPKKLGKYGKLKEVTVQSLGEGLEEMYQFVSAEESDYNVKRVLGLIDESEFSDRMGDYFGNTEMWNSAVAGIFGGAIFNTIGKLTDKDTLLTKKQKELKNQILTDRAQAFGNLVNTIKEADESEVLKASEEVRKSANTVMTIDALNKNQFDYHLEFLRSLENMSQEELDQTSDAIGTDYLSSDFIRNLVPNLIKDAINIRNEYLKHINTGNKEQRALLALNRHNLSNALEVLTKANKTKSSLESKIPQLQDLSSYGSSAYSRRANIASLKRAKEISKRVYANNPERLESFQNELDAQIKKLQSNREKDNRTKEERQSDKEIFEALDNHQDFINAGAQIALTKKHIKELEKEYKDLVSNKTPKKLKKKKIEKQIKDSKTKEEVGEVLETFSVTDNNEEGDVFDSLELNQEDDVAALQTLGNNKLEELSEENKKQADNISSKLAEMDLGSLSTQEKQTYARNKEEIDKKVEKKIQDKDKENVEKAEQVTKKDWTEPLDNYLQQKFEDVERNEPNGIKVVQPFIGDKTPESEKQAIEDYNNWLLQPIDKTKYEARFEVIGEDIKVTFWKNDAQAVIDGRVVYSWLYKTGNFQAQKDFRNEVLKDPTVTAKVEGQMPFEIISDGDHNIIDSFGEDVEIVYSNSEGIYKRLDGTPIVLGNGKKSKQIGVFFATTLDNRGKKIPLKLNSHKLNRDEADVIADVYEQLMSDKNPNKYTEEVSKTIKDKLQAMGIININTPSSTWLISDLSYSNVLDFFVYDSQSTKAFPKHTLYLQMGVLYYGDNKMSIENFDRNSLIDFLQTKNFNTKPKKLLNKKYRDFVFNNKLSTTSPSGQKFYKKDSFNGALYLSKGLITNKDVTATQEVENKSKETKAKPLNISYKDKVLAMRKNKGKSLSENTGDTNDTQDNKVC